MSRASALPSADDRTVLALIEINRYEALKRTVGYASAADLLVTLAERVRALPECRSARDDRHHVEAMLACPPSRDLAQMLHDIARAIGGGIEIQGYEVQLSVRIGAADAPDGATATALALAERALARAGERRRIVAIAQPEDESAFTSRLAFMCGLQQAIREDHLELHYQPKIRARSGKTAALEALVRWNHPTEGMIPPDRFIGLAEESGDIARLTEWVIGRAIADQTRLLKQHGIALPIDINISGCLIADAGWAWDTLMMFTAVQGDIGFEITETAMIADPERALENLRTIADAGIKLSIDDYGSGFSSLAYLQQLPVSELKIDRMFISRLASGQRDPLLVRSTIELAHALEMEVTAEGVDSPEALALLQVMGCDLLQGFHLSRPLPFDRLVGFLDAERTRGEVALPAAHERLRQRLTRAK